MTSVLLVCRANLCRSPMAEVVFRACALALRVQRVASAGVWAGSRPERMDPRAAACLERRRYVLDPKWRSRKVAREDLAKFEIILALDNEVLGGLQKLFPEAPARRLRLLLDHVPGLAGQDVPDPYYSSAQGFEHALDLIERAVGSFRP